MRHGLREPLAPETRLLLAYGSIDFHWPTKRIFYWTICFFLMGLIGAETPGTLQARRLVYEFHRNVKSEKMRELQKLQ